MLVGYIGVGLMGHGAAKNILEKGYALTVMGHRNRASVEDLVGRGAGEAATPADVAQSADVVFLCLPSSVEVEATVGGDQGVLAGMRDGMILVDSTTADPVVTRRIGAALAAKGCAMLDAALGRSPRTSPARSSITSACSTS
jgi:3-hydroxyisobutyrate dehydrogenase-like beta-hydroxyacid dehydrogenase